MSDYEKNIIDGLVISRDDSRLQIDVRNRVISDVVVSYQPKDAHRMPKAGEMAKFPATRSLRNGAVGNPGAVESVWYIGDE